MSGQRDKTTETTPHPDDKEPHKVDEKVQEEATKERADNPGYD